VDIFDFIPIVPPGMPDGSGERPRGYELASGVGSVLLPAINAVVVLFAGFTHSGTVALLLMPLVSGALLYLLARWQSVGVAWGLLYAMCCAAFCFIGNSCALLLVGLLGFFHTF
jgi:hypothetical protein